MRDYAETAILLRNWPRICAEYKDSLDELHDDAADAIEELQAQVPHWISVEERLPEVCHTVLVTNGEDVYTDYRIRVIRNRKRADEWAHDDATFPITHWMQLPAPPKEDT